MTRVATFAVQNLAFANTQKAQARNAELEIAVSSGQKSQNYKGIAEDSRSLINFENLRESALRYIDNIDTAERRLTDMETATAQLFDLATELRTLLVTATSSGNAPDLLLQAKIDEMLEQAVGLLNLDQDGRYLFAGSRTDTRPVDLDTLLNPAQALVDTIEYTGAATAGGTGINSLTGIVSLRVPSGSTDDALQLTYDGVANLTITNLVNGASNSVAIPSLPAAGETASYTVTVAGLDVEVTIDDQFQLATPITTQPIAGTVGGGAGAIGAINVVSTLGDVSQINNRIIDIASPTNDAADITLTLPSADGNFVATGLDFKSATGVQTVTLTNPISNAEVTLTIDITTVLADPTANDPGTEIDLGDFLANLAATAGATSSAAAAPGQTGYDPSDPAYYKGDKNRVSLRADDDLTVDYGVTAIDSGFEKLIRTLMVARSASSGSSVNVDDLNDALGLANEAISEIPQIRSDIGTSRATLENVKRVQEDSTLLAEKTIGEFENTDIAGALTLLAQNTTTIEASYSTIGRLNGLSLLQFI